MSKTYAKVFATWLLCFSLIFITTGISHARLSSSPAGKSVGFSFQADNSIYFAREYGAELKKIFSGGNNLTIRSHKIAASGLHIAIEARNSDRKLVYDRADEVRFGEDLLIINIDGELLHKFETDKLVDYSWAPEGDRFIYVTGVHKRADDQSDFTSGEVLNIFDLKKGEQQTVVADSNEVFVNVSWTLFDGNIYLWKRVFKKYRAYDGVFKYDFNSDKLNPTTFKSVDLSPDGKYYFIDSYPGSIGAELYLASSGKKVELITPEKMKQSWIDYPDMMFDSSLKLLDWIIVGNKSFAIICNQGIDGALNRLKISGFWKLDCDTGRSIELPAPNGISPTHQLPAGLKDGKLVWAAPDAKGVYRTAIIDQ